MSKSIPHGGTLVNLFETSFNYKFINQEIELDNTALSDLEPMGTGAYSPLRGFIKAEGYISNVDHMRLADGMEYTYYIAY